MCIGSRPGSLPPAIVERINDGNATVALQLGEDLLKHGETRQPEDYAVGLQYIADYREYLKGDAHSVPPRAGISPKN